MDEFPFTQANDNFVLPKFFGTKILLNLAKEKIEEKNSIHPNDKQHKTLDLQRIGSLSSSGGGDSENERYQS